MSLGEYLHILRRRWPVIVVCVAIGVAAGVLVNGDPAAPGSTGYEATTIVLVRQIAPDEASARPGIVTSIDTIAALATVGEVPQRVANLLDQPEDVARLAARVRAGGDRSTGLMRITVIARAPDQAEVISRLFATELRSFLKEREKEGTRQALVGLDARIEDLEEQISRSGDVPQGSLDYARLESKAATLELLLTERSRLAADKSDTLVIIGSPNATPIDGPALAVPVGSARVLILAALGLLMGIGVVLLGARLDVKVRTREDAEKAFGAPVLAEIPVLPRRWRKLFVADVDPLSAAADSFGLLGSAVLHVIARDGEEDPGVRPPAGPILVTSASHGEGKTTVAMNMAAAIAEMGKSVLLISADFRSSTLPAGTAAEQRPGLTDALRDASSDKARLDGLMTETAIPGLRLLASGTAPDRLSELLSSPAMIRLMREARLRADVVIVDAAPILAARDTAVLLRDARFVVLVAGAGRVSVDLAESASETLGQLGVRVAGVVLNASIESPAIRAGGRSRRARRLFRAATATSSKGSASPGGQTDVEDEPTTTLTAGA